MEHTIIVGGKSYILPKKTLAVMESLDAVLKVDTIAGLSVRQKFEKLHDFMKNTVGQENCKEMFGSDDLDEIDLTELSISIKKVVDAYERPVNEYDFEKARDQMKQLPLDKIISLANAAGKMPNIK